MDDRYLRVLKELEPRGIDVETDMDDTINTIVSAIKEMQPSDFSFNEVRDRFIDVMSKNEHVTNGIGENDKMMLRLQFKGLQFLNEYRLTVSNIELNKSTLESNRVISANTTTQSKVLTRQTIILGVVGSFALLSLIVSIMTYKLDDKTQQLSTEIEQLKQDSLKLQKELFQLKKPHTKTTTD